MVAESLRYGNKTRSNEQQRSRQLASQSVAPQSGRLSAYVKHRGHPSRMATLARIRCYPFVVATVTCASHCPLTLGRTTLQVVTAAIHHLEAAARGTSTPS